MSISLLLIEDYRIIHNSILVHKNHAVNIAHIGILVEKTYYILALLKHNIELGIAHTAPSGRLSCIYNRLTAVDTQFHGAFLACYEVDSDGVLWMSTVGRGLERVTVIRPEHILFQL